MSLAEFIHHHRKQIQSDWEVRAFGMRAEEAGDSLVLQPHMEALLDAIAKDLFELRSQANPSAPHAMAVITAAMRDLAGSSLRLVGEETRMLRTTIGDMWRNAAESHSPHMLQDINDFHAVMDAILCSYIAHYSGELARARDGFLSILGHDLRSPLSAITIAGDYLSMPGMLEGTPLQAALGIKNSAASMSAMIRNLMAYAKLRLGKKIEVLPERSDIGNICEAAVMKAQLTFPDYAFQAQVKAKVCGEVDPLRLQQVLDNLIEGAVQQGANGQPITLAAYENGRGIFIEVETAGAAAALDALQLIVDPAVQIPFDAAEPDEKLIGIVGLGLFAAREIVLAHGGTIAVEIAEHGGTLFRVRLPLQPTKIGKDVSERRWRFA